jgi:hypothetical protein
MPERRTRRTYQENDKQHDFPRNINKQEVIRANIIINELKAKAEEEAKAEKAKYILAKQDYESAKIEIEKARDAGVRGTWKMSKFLNISVPEYNSMVSDYTSFVKEYGDTL